MTSVAKELHDLYVSWRGKFGGKAGQPYVALRPREADGVAEFRRAYRLITRIDDLLTRFEAEGRTVAVFRRHLDGWARVPLVIDGWGQNVRPEQVVPQVVLDQLETFDAYLEGKVLTLDDSRMPGLRTLVAQASSALNEDEELPQPMAAYFRRLLSEIQFALDDEAIGRGFDFADAVQRLWVTLNAAAEASPREERKSSWRGLRDQVLVGVTTNGAIEAVKAAIAITTGLAG